MDGGCFRPAQNYGYVRATTMMNSKSSNDFRWSVRLTGDTRKWIGLGIASNELVHNELSETIYKNDKNAIVYYPYFGILGSGKASSPWSATQSIPKGKSGDEIQFRFQPKMKKFLISIVSQLF